MVAQGYDDASIAERRGLLVSRVEHLVSQIYEQLKLDTLGEIDPRVESARIYMAAKGVPSRG